MTTITAPALEETPVRVDEIRRDRELTTRIVLLDREFERHGETFHSAVDITTWYQRDAKQFRSFAHHVTVSERWVRAVIGFGHSTVPMPRAITPVSRFSQKALEAAHQRYVDSARSPLMWRALLAWAAAQDVSD
ncbi:hypothetical protein E4U02_15430 [Microbacterium paludicola]|uniref:Uncharacterized protein n=1 Tax=Microbacterium paludicola TaxID=300019 RepID=A0A4Y9FL67_9MICO|nr:hypothetical protein [Microbacterium paludicola]MBF0817793.1 hypothetical protein [Microbacterium paludicola]TFU29786.1 hypothetical protein E4U02_15430 [Microbacterium paludicola]